MMKNKKLILTETGFSLIEIMIVLALIAILSAVSSYYYSNWIKKSRKTEAKTNLSALALLIEEYNSIYGRYCPDCTDSNNHIYVYKENDDGTILSDNITNWLDFKPKQASDSSMVRYDYKIVANSNNNYLITANPVLSRQVLSDSLTINQDGVKTDGNSTGW